MDYINLKFEEERSLYHLNSSLIENCIFEGKADGESPLKEGNELTVNKCNFSLRYPLWHNTSTKVLDSNFNNTSRAPFWYCKDLTLNKCNVDAPKAIRECEQVLVNQSNITSDECGWKSKQLVFKNSNIEGFYFLFNCERVSLTRCNLKGKYSFQYIKNLAAEQCNFITKDAFWHVDGATIKDCHIEGEYIGWYSKNITFINCTFKGTQPFCYCENLKLINCKFENADLAFENSEVNATITSKMVSIKNSKSGYIEVEELDELILKDYVNEPKAVINCKNIKNTIK